MSEKKNNSSVLIALLLFLGAGALLFFSMTSETPTVATESQSQTKKYEDRVNRHLMLTNQKMELQRQRVIVDNNTYARDIHETERSVAYENGEGVDLSTDTHAKDVARELGRGERETNLPVSPHELIQSEIFTQKQQQDYSENYKAEYAKKFVENAARGGWKINLSSDYRVISVTPIRVPTGQELFESSGRSSQ